MISTEKLRDKLFRLEDYPYQIYERKIASVLSNVDTILDAGCGRNAPLLRKFSGKERMLIGVDLEDRSVKLPGIRFIKCDISNISLKDKSVDLIISRSVLEHVRHPIFVYKELNRILKPGGSFIFLVPNLGHYASIISLLIPNRHHSTILSSIEDKQENDVFPVYYKSNTYSSIKKLSKLAGFEIADFQYLGQYPYYFMFNPFLFFIAAIYVKIINRFNCFGFLRGCILAHLTKQFFERRVL